MFSKGTAWLIDSARTSVGLLLALAAVFKLPQLLTGAISPSWWVLVGVELGLGTWLVLGVAVVCASALAAMLFTAFSLINAFFLWHQVPRCACLGLLPASPAWMLPIDLAALAFSLLALAAQLPRRSTLLLGRKT